MLRTPPLTMPRLGTLALAVGIATTSAFAIGGPSASAAGSRSVRPSGSSSSSALKKIGLLAVSAVSGSSHAWAVGDAEAIIGCGAGYVLRYNGHSWRSVRAGLPASTGVFGVAAASAKAIWIVGEAGSCSKPRPYLGYSSGGAFKTRKVTNATTGELEAISAASGRDIWAVGYSGVTSARALVLHWNGHTWAKVATPAQANRLRLTAVSASSSKNVWVIGSRADYSSAMLHWNGKRWSTHKVASNTYLAGIATSGSTRAWVVGLNENGSDSAYSARWNGTAWTAVAAPKLSITLEGVTMSGKRAWAVGEAWTSTSSERAIPEVLYSTGGRWASQPAPDPSASKSGSNQSALFGVSAASASLVVAVGENAIECSSGSGFADVYRSGTWHPMSAPAVPPAARTAAQRRCGG